MVRGAQAPRIRVVPEGVDHPLWPEVAEFVEATGTRLDPWQWDVLRTSLLREGERWAAFSVAVCAPRQNGKNAVLEMRELAGALLLGERLIVHSAHQADTGREAFRRMDDLIDANEWLSAEVRHVRRTNGFEAVEFRNGARIRFRTRTRVGGRGFSGSPLVFDEAMYLSEASMGSILPVASAQPDPQVWYAGSAVDQEIHDDAVVFARVRERALRGDTDRLAFFEWSHDADSPDEVTEEQAADPAVWAATNPAFGIRITPEYVLAERAELDPRTFAVERLGVGDWPATQAGEETVVDMGLWELCEDRLSELLDPVCFAYDVSPDRQWASIGVAGLRPDGLAHVEVVEHRRGTGWVARRLWELCGRHETVGEVVCDRVGAGGSLLPELEKLGVAVSALTASEYASACGLFFDEVEQERLRHLGSAELAAALRGAATRPLGEAWAWSRKHSRAVISPLVACTLALWGVRSARPEPPRRRWVPLLNTEERAAWEQRRGSGA